MCSFGALVSGAYQLSGPTADVKFPTDPVRRSVASFGARPQCADRRRSARVSTKPHAEGCQPVVSDVTPTPRQPGILGEHAVLVDQLEQARQVHRSHRCVHGLDHAHVATGHRRQRRRDRASPEAGVRGRWATRLQDAMSLDPREDSSDRLPEDRGQRIPAGSTFGCSCDRLAWRAVASAGAPRVLSSGQPWPAPSPSDRRFHPAATPAIRRGLASGRQRTDSAGRPDTNEGGGARLRPRCGGRSNSRARARRSRT